MAWFNPQKNRGHKGGNELGFGGTYGIATKVERYKSTEEYMGYGSYPGPGLHAGYGPERKEHGPWTSASLDRTKKGDMFGSTNYAHRDNSPPPRGKFHKNNNKNYYSSDDEDDVVCDDEQCYPKPKGHVDHNIPYHETNSYPNDGYNNSPTYTAPVTTQPRKDHSNNRHTYTAPVTTQPTYTAPVTTQPRKDHSNNRPTYTAPVTTQPTYTAPVTTQPRKDHSNNRPTYTAPVTTQPTYTAPVTIQPRKDHSNNRPTYTAPVTTQPREDYSNNRPTYTVPVTTQPRKDPYYEPANSKDPYFEPANSNRTVVHKPLPPVKTISDHHTKVKGVDSPVSGGSPFASSRGSPFASSRGSPFTPSPRKEHDYGSREGVDSPGGRTRNKGASPRGGVWAAEINYKGTIDSKKAAEKYGGVFVDY